MAFRTSRKCQAQVEITSDADFFQEKIVAQTCQSKFPQSECLVLKIDDPVHPHFKAHYEPLHTGLPTDEILGLSKSIKMIKFVENLALDDLV